MAAEIDAEPNIVIELAADAYASQIVWENMSWV